MADRLTLETFAPLVGQRFAVAGAELELAEAAGLGPPPTPDLPAPFRLTFRGPRSPLLTQGIHRLAHDTCGPLDVFLVPLGPDAAGPRYEALFG